MKRKSTHVRILWILNIFLALICNKANSDMGKLKNPINQLNRAFSSQFITGNNTKIYAQKGGLAVLPCVVKLTSPATVSWIRRRDFQLLTVGLSTHSSDKRFLVEHTRHMGHWSLRIKSVGEEDKGFYECLLSIYPSQSIFIELKVIEAFAEILGGPDLHIDEGSTLKLTCGLTRATETPTFVFWYHNRKMVNYDLLGGYLVTSITDPHTHTEDCQYYHENNLVNMELMPVKREPAMPFDQFASKPLISILTIMNTRLYHAGNYTCAPANVRSASISIHVLKGEVPAAMQYVNRSKTEAENSSLDTSPINSVKNVKSDIIVEIKFYIIVFAVYVRNFGSHLIYLYS